MEEACASVDRGTDEPAPAATAAPRSKPVRLLLRLDHENRTAEVVNGEGTQALAQEVEPATATPRAVAGWLPAHGGSLPSVAWGVLLVSMVRVQSEATSGLAPG